MVSEASRQNLQQTVVIIDFSFLFHLAAAAALRAGPNYDLSLTTQANAEGKLRTMRRQLAKLRIVGYDLVFAEDRAPKRKYALFPGYRHDARNDQVQEKLSLKQFLINNGYAGRFCHSEDNEADDTIATLTRLATEARQFVVIVSGDRDLWQLISPTVAVYNPVKQAIVSSADIERAFHCRAHQIPLYKALWGDYGDGIPNVLPRLQKHLLPVLCSTDGSLADFERQITTQRFYLQAQHYERYLTALPQIRINYELVFLDAYCCLSYS